LALPPSNTSYNLGYVNLVITTHGPYRVVDIREREIYTKNYKRELTLEGLTA
jgi:hypothetical protein